MRVKALHNVFAVLWVPTAISFPAMPAFPLSLRLAVWPLWGVARLREVWFGRARPLVRLRVSARSPLPPAHHLMALVGSKVRAVHLVVEHVASGWATLREARSALKRVRDSGIPVFVELESCGNAELYLASVGDRVWLRPMVDVHAVGIGATLRFAGDALERFGLKFDVEAAGTYKSAGETLSRSFASAANREAIAAVVTDLQDELVETIAAGRRVDPAVVRSAIEAAPLSGDDALARGLVDAVTWPDAVVTAIEDLLGGPPVIRSFARWRRVQALRAGLENWIEGRPQIAVVHLRGPVVDGDGPPSAQSIAAKPVHALLEALREDEDVVGVVLAVQSPGGSAIASDHIWRAVVRLHQRKPVVAAFVDVAASGGYYIAAPATEIFAQPNTLTGSIGVVGGKLVLGGALARAGVFTEHVLGAPEAAMFSADAPFTPSQRIKFRESLDRFYRGFVERVAAGRRRPYAAVEEHARGRVWSGKAALERGLVDRIGGVGDAVERAAQLAGAHSHARVDIHVGPRTSWLVRFLRGRMAALVPELAAIPSLPPLTRFLLSSVKVPLLLWPFEVEVE